LHCALCDFDRTGSDSFLEGSWFGVFDVGEAFSFVDFDFDDGAERGESGEEERLGDSLRGISVLEEAVA